MIKLFFVVIFCIIPYISYAQNTRENSLKDKLEALLIDDKLSKKEQKEFKKIIDSSLVKMTDDILSDKNLRLVDWFKDAKNMQLSTDEVHLYVYFVRFGLIKEEDIKTAENWESIKDKIRKFQPYQNKEILIKRDDKASIKNNLLIHPYEVDQYTYRLLMGNSPSIDILEEQDSLPIENVSWYEAIEYANKLSKLLGYDPVYTIKDQEVTINEGANGYRLPTVTEWEYVAKNNKADHSFLIYSKDFPTINEHPFSNFTKQSNNKKIMNLKGSVWEWCWDSKKGDNTAKAVKGGSWLSPIHKINAHNLSYAKAENGGHSVGFRLMRYNTQ